MSNEQWQCERRKEVGAFGHDHHFKVPDFDEWRSSGEMRTCSWCGSLHPEDFLKWIRAGKKIVPTDKNYKYYVGDAAMKFYMQHFSKEQLAEFRNITHIMH